MTTINIKIARPSQGCGVLCSLPPPVGFPLPFQKFVWDPVLLRQGLGHRVILIIMAIGVSLVGFSCTVKS